MNPAFVPGISAILCYCTCCTGYAMWQWRKGARALADSLKPQYNALYCTELRHGAGVSSTVGAARSRKPKLLESMYSTVQYNSRMAFIEAKNGGGWGGFGYPQWVPCLYTCQLRTCHPRASEIAPLRMEKPHKPPDWKHTTFEQVQSDRATTATSTAQHYDKKCSCSSPQVSSMPGVSMRMARSTPSSHLSHLRDFAVGVIDGNNSVSHAQLLLLLLQLLCTGARQ